LLDNIPRDEGHSGYTNMT